MRGFFEVLGVRYTEQDQNPYSEAENLSLYLLWETRRREWLARNQNRQTGAPVAGQEFPDEGAFQRSWGQTAAPPSKDPPKILTIRGASTDLIQPLHQKISVRYGLPVELMVAKDAFKRIFLMHPDDCSFDSMELSVTGQTEGGSEDSPWVAQAQLCQRRLDRLWQISGLVTIKKNGAVQRHPTAISLASSDSVIELDAGFIERPWALLVDVAVINKAVGTVDENGFYTAPPDPPPSWAVNARIQVTVNFISQAA